MASFEKEADATITEFGAEFRHEYGWAAKVLGVASPTFTSIEKAVNLDKWRPYFKMACHGVHAGSQGLFFSLGLPADTFTLVAGASNAGLADPGHCAAISLTMATSTLLAIDPELDDLITGVVMQLLTDDIGNALIDAHNQLESEESDIIAKDARNGGTADQLSITGTGRSN
jgi:hypothetical protein